MTVAANDVLREQLLRAVQRSPGVMRSSLYRIGRIYGSGTVQDREGEVVDALDALVRGGVVRQRAVPDGAGQSRVATEVAYFAVDARADDDEHDDESEEVDMTNAERALAYLRSHGPSRPEDIAEALGIHRSTVSGALRGRDDVRIEYVDPANPRKGGVWMLVETTPRGCDDGCASRRGYTTCDCGAEAERAEDLAGKLVGILADHVDGAVDGGAVDTLRRLIAERDMARVRASDFEQQLDDLVVERLEQRTVAERDEARAKREVDRAKREVDRVTAERDEARKALASYERQLEVCDTPVHALTGPAQLAHIIHEWRTGTALDHAARMIETMAARGVEVPPPSVGPIEQCSTMLALMDVPGAAAAAEAKVEEMREHARREVQRIGDVLDRVAEAVGLVGADGGDRIIAEVRHVVERSHRLRDELESTRAKLTTIGAAYDALAAEPCKRDEALTEIAKILDVPVPCSQAEVVDAVKLHRATLTATLETLREGVHRPVWVEWGYHHLYVQGSTVLGDITTNNGGDAKWTVPGVGDGRANDIGCGRRIVEAVVAAGRQS